MKSSIITRAISVYLSLMLLSLLTCPSPLCSCYHAHSDVITRFSEQELKITFTCFWHSSKPQIHNPKNHAVREQVWSICMWAAVQLYFIVMWRVITSCWQRIGLPKSLTLGFQSPQIQKKMSPMCLPWSRVLLVIWTLSTSSLSPCLLPCTFLKGCYW